VWQRNEIQTLLRKIVMLLPLVSLIIKITYIALPILALLAVIARPKRLRGLPGALVVSIVAGLGVSVALNLIYATATRGRVSIAQLVLGTYFAAAMFLLLRLVDAGLQFGLNTLFKLNDADTLRLRRTRSFFALIGRVGILFAVGLPYVMATLMIYRPRVLPNDNPRVQLGFDYERVEFRASDNVRIVGWWIPAQQPQRRALRARDDDQTDSLWAKRTAIVCHGLASSKSNQLILARKLVPAGFNCVAIDFRAHGESGGQLTTFGALEKRDVLAAVKWVRQTHADQSQQIVGVGASMGAAALISAAADDSPEGRAISAIASYACYDDLWDMTKSMTQNYFAAPMNDLLLYVGLPIAQLQTGADLMHYSPAKDAAKLWPRPILLIHGQRDEIIDFSRGESLFDAIPQPKYHLWYPTGGHNDILNDDSAGKIVEEFFKRATSQPVI
jgi:fermentation-respiration switch protein FrsA (DUF1100 family)